MNYMMSRQSFSDATGRPALSSAHEGFVTLIRTYPHLSPAEMSELHSHFGRLRALDIALMMNDDDLSRRVETYCTIHGRGYHPPLSGYLMLLALMALVAAVGMWGAAS